MQLELPGSEAWICFAHGACLPNPGVMGIGGFMVSPGGLRHEFSESPGHGTRNEAEYLALIRMLEVAREAGANILHVHIDSQIATEQITGRWACKKDILSALLAKFREISETFEEVNLIHVPRHDNRFAPDLAERAVLRSEEFSKKVDSSSTVKVIEVSPGIFLATGKSGRYAVDLNNYSCSCPDFRNRGNTSGPCKHIIAAMFKFGGKSVPGRIDQIGLGF
jgi:ribonuclease HI